MNAIPLQIDECVNALIGAFRVEDIWMLEASAYPDSDLDPVTLIVIVPQDEAAHEIEAAATTYLRDICGANAPAVAVFNISAIERLPRPLLVKMALSKGIRIHSA